MSKQPLKEFVVFSDLHAHNFTYGATRVSIPMRYGLYNSRLADTVAVLDEIRDYCNARKIKETVFCGDLFHRRTSLSTDVRHVIHDALVEFDDDSIRVHLMAGNHDLGDRDGHVHHLAGLTSSHIMLRTLTPSAFEDGSGVMFHFVRYLEDRSATVAAMQDCVRRAQMNPDQKHILFGHMGVQGAKVGSDYVLISEHDVKVDEIPYNHFDACFFGHYHEHQQLFRNGWYVGATHQHNWGDTGGTRGFLHVKVFKDKVEFKHVETQAPKFVIKHHDKPSPEMKANDFVRYITDDPFQDKHELKKKWGINHLELVAEAKEEDDSVTLDVSQLAPDKILEEWIKFKNTDFDEEELLKMGQDILKDSGL